MRTNIATKITEAIATWRFIAVTMTVCGTELWFNQSSLVPASWQFDKTMLVLNTMLSLWAAMQCSLIMIAQAQADAKRDAILEKILMLEEKIAQKEGVEDATTSR